MPESITALLIDDSPQIREVAQLIIDLDNALQDRTITRPEYNSLLFDIERLRLVISQAHNIRAEIIIHQAVEGLLTLAKAIW